MIFKKTGRFTLINGSPVCAIPSLPPGVALPGGLSFITVSADSAASMLLTAPANAVLLRFRTSLCVSDGGNTSAAVESLLESSLMFVDGIALASESAMHAAVGSRAELSLFLSPQADYRSNNRGITFASVKRVLAANETASLCSSRRTGRRGARRAGGRCCSSS